MLPVLRFVCRCAIYSCKYHDDWINTNLTGFTTSLVTARIRIMAQGNVFRRICHAVHMRGMGVSARHPQADLPLQADIPLADTLCSKPYPLLHPHSTPHHSTPHPA